MPKSAKNLEKTTVKPGGGSSVSRTEPVAVENTAMTREALSMIQNYDDEDVEVGRMSTAMDTDTYFDSVPPREAWFTAQDAQDVLKGDGDEVEDPQPFQPLPDGGAEQFPVLKSALRHFQAQESKPRTVRFDTADTYGDLISEATIRELDRRLRELRGLVEEHLADHHGAPVEVMRKWDVIGAARSIADLRSASTAAEAAEKLEQVPLDLPGFAQGKVHCWQDGDCIVCSIHFSAANGEHRIATAGARPSVDTDDVAASAIRAGVDPAVVLGALPELAAVATGKRLVKDVARAALQAQEREDVLGISTEPVLLSGGGDAGSAPLAAVMYLHQRADAGDAQAVREVAKLNRAAQTPSGRQIAAPVLAEARRRLSEGRQKKAQKKVSGLMQHYARAAGWGL